MKKFRIWHMTQFGLAIEIKKAKSIELLKLSKKLKANLIEIEEL